MTVTIGRRELLAALGSAVAAWPLAARAQHIGFRVRKIEDDTIFVSREKGIVNVISLKTSTSTSRSRCSRAPRCYVPTPLPPAT
jgi:hypothetical protein